MIINKCCKQFLVCNIFVETAIMFSGFFDLIKSFKKKTQQLFEIEISLNKCLYCHLMQFNASLLEKKY